VEVHWSLVLGSPVEQQGQQHHSPMHSRTEAVEVPMLQAQQQTQATWALEVTAALAL
jgi:hypothetical protein